MRIGGNTIPLYPGQIGGMERTAREALKVLEEAASIGRRPTNSPP
jgi:hypothetical protein